MLLGHKSIYLITIYGEKKKYDRNHNSGKAMDLNLWEQGRVYAPERARAKWERIQV